MRRTNSPVVQLDELVGFFRLAVGFQAQRLRVQREYVFELVGGALDEKRSRIHITGIIVVSGARDVKNGDGRGRRGEEKKFINNIPACRRLSCARWRRPFFQKTKILIIIKRRKYSIYVPVVSEERTWDTRNIEHLKILTVSRSASKTNVPGTGEGGRGSDASFDRRVLPRYWCRTDRRGRKSDGKKIRARVSVYKYMHK